MTRLLLAATALVSVAFLPSAHAAECRPDAVCEAVCRAVCATVCRLTCEPPDVCTTGCIEVRDPCSIVQCNVLCTRFGIC